MTIEIDWPQLLAEITSKRDALNQVIETLTTHFVRNGAGHNAQAAARLGPGRPKKKPGRKAGHRGRAARAVAITDEQDEAAAIVAQLKAHGAMAPSALAQKLKISVPMLRARVRPLAQAGRVVLTGKTMNRQVALPRPHAAKEAP